MDNTQLIILSSIALPFIASALNLMRPTPRVTTDVVKLSACSTNYSQPLLVSKKCARDSLRIMTPERNITRLLKPSERINCAKQWREKTKKLKLTQLVLLLNLATADLNSKTLKRLMPPGLKDSWSGRELRRNYTRNTL